MNMSATDSNSSAESLDLSCEIHKSLRLALFELAWAAGAFDPPDHPNCHAFRVSSCAACSEQ
jgi:hypothetical protein